MPVKINPLVLSLGAAFDTVVDPTICVDKKGKKMKKKKKIIEKQEDKHINEDEEDFDFENETNSEDKQFNLVKWCVEEEFKRGKARFVNTSHELDGLAEQNKWPNVAMLVVDSNLPKKMKRKKTLTLHVELPECITRNNVLWYLLQMKSYLGVVQGKMVMDQQLICPK